MALLDFFSKNIQGGLSENTVYVLRGVPASGKTAFSLTLANEFLAKGKRVLFVTTELSPENVLEHAGRMGIDLKEAAARKQLLFVDAYSWKVGKRDSSVVDASNLPELAHALIEASSANNLVFFFDSLTTLLLFNEPASVVKFIEVITARFRSTHCSGFFVLEEGVSDERVVNALSFLVDGIFETRIDESRASFNRIFRIFSVKTAAHSTEWHPFSVEASGFRFLETSTVKK